MVTDDNGLYQMRARYYNPEIKAFINEDDLAGSVENSQSLNRYAYANGNPIIYVDPLGHAPEGTGKTFRIASTTYAPTYAPKYVPRISFPSLGEVAAGAAGIASKALGVFGGVILDILLNPTPVSDEGWTYNASGDGDAEIKDLRPLPKDRIDDLGGEDYTSKAKAKSGSLNLIYIGILTQEMFIQFQKMVGHLNG